MKRNLAEVATRFGGGVVTRPREFLDTLPDLVLLSGSVTQTAPPDHVSEPREAPSAEIGKQPQRLDYLRYVRWPTISGAAVALAAAAVGLLVSLPLLFPAEPDGQVVVGSSVPAVDDGDVANLVLSSDELRTTVPEPTVTWGPASVTDEWLASTSAWAAPESDTCAALLSLTGAATEKSGSAYGTFAADAAISLYSFGRAYESAPDAKAAFDDLHPAECGSFAIAVPGGTITATSTEAEESDGTTDQDLIWSATEIQITMPGTPEVTVDRWCSRLERLLVCHTAWGANAELNDTTVAAATVRMDQLVVPSSPTIGARP